MKAKRVLPPRAKEYYRRWRASKKPHRHQRMVSRVLRTLRERLGLTLAQLGEQIGVSEKIAFRWSQPQGNLAHPEKRRLSDKRGPWTRVEELWWLMEYSKTEEFNRDRVVPPRFDK